MNRKQFLVLVIALIVLGGVGIAIFWQNLDDYRASGAKIGAKLMPGLKLADVALVELRDAKNKTTLVRKENFWVVQERESYPADFKAISDLIIKLSDLKVVQADTVGEALLPRVELVAPAEGAKPEGTGTLVELKDPAGKTLAALVLGKKVLKKDPGNPLPAAQDGVPAGRYIRIVGGNDQVVVVSDPLANAEANPGRWLDKDFAKIDRVKTLSVAGDDGGWKITRDVEWGQWKFAGGGGDLDASAAVGAVNALGQLSFNDVAIGKPESEGNPLTIVAETFDNLTYTLKLAKRKSASEYLLNVSVAGELPAAREAEKDEKAEDKERRDKDFAESRKRLELRMLRDKARSDWTYVVDAKQVAPLLKGRSDLIAQRKPPVDPRQPPQ
jgi:hypothetical protein